MRRPLALLLFGLLLPIAFTASASAASYCDGSGYLVHTPGGSGNSVLLRFDPITGDTTEVATLPAHVNALAADDSGFYGIARPGARAVRIGLDGTLTPLGPVRGAPAGNFASAFAGAAHQGSWLLMEDDAVYRVALSGVDAPAVVSRAPLAGPIRIGDWATDADGRLLTIDTEGSGPARLVRIDPDTGAISVLARPTGLPATSVYGAVWVVGDQLYALHNEDGVIYRIDLTRPDLATAVAGGLPTTGADGAACPAPAVPPSPSPSPSASASPSASPAPSASRSPAPSASVVPSSSSSPPSSSPPSVVIPPIVIPPAPEPPIPPISAVAPPAAAVPQISPAVPAPTPPPPTASARVTPPPLRPATPPPPPEAVFTPKRPIAAEVDDSAAKMRMRKFVAVGIVAMAVVALLGVSVKSGS